MSDTDDMSDMSGMSERDARSRVGAACADFDERLAAWIEGDLQAGEAAEVEWHRSQCARCGAIADELRALQQRVVALPPLSPSRDLWAGIESRLVDRHRASETDHIGVTSSVISSASTVGDLTAYRARKSRVAEGGVHRDLRWIGIAALLLVSVTAGVTWRIAQGSARASVAASSTPIASPTIRPDSALDATTLAVQPEPAVPVAGESSAVGASTRAAEASAATSAGRGAGTESARYVSSGDTMDADRVYEREVRALRLIVERRFRELDTATVRVLRDNLKIIDQAIIDSRRALDKDPNSGLLSSQLDRSLEAKLELMRRVALL